MRQIGKKYHTEGDIYKHDGTLIPASEPLILFRGRDRLVPQLLDYYLKLRLELGGPQGHIDLLKTDIDSIKQWQNNHPNEVKTPE